MTKLEETQQLLAELLDSGKITAAALARRLSVSSALISQVKSGVYKANESKDLQRIHNECLALLNKSQTGWQLAATKTFEIISQIADICQSNGLSAGLAAAPGTGKSATAKYLVAARKNVFLVECADYFTRNVFLEKLMRSLSLTPDGLPVQARVEKVISYLAGIENPLLILDEADKLRDNVLPLYRVLYNALDGHCGFLLLGTHYLKKKIEKGVQFDKLAYRETYSAIGGKLNSLPDLALEDVKAVCNANGILEADKISFAFNSCNGDLRRVKRLCEIWKNQ